MRNKIILALPVLFFILLFGCEKGVDNNDMGILSIKLTDTPIRR